MSYSIGFYVIEKDTNKYVCVGCSNVNPSYNYSKVLKSAMRWDYKSSEYYRCDDVLKHITLGIEELFDYAQFKKIVALSNLIQRRYHNDIRNMLP